MTRVKTSRRPVELFGLAAAATLCGQRQAFQQRHDVDAAGFQHRAVAERDLVQLQFVDALGDRRARSGQKARAHAKGDLAEPQIEAGGLDLVGDEVVGRQNGADASELRDHVIGQDALLVGGKGERHVVLRACAVGWARAQHSAAA